ncbi:TPA: hypothetical protein DEG21_05415 [Patescibacteria group bacterium]|nr:hypothetical protein [Candidatus Gracilibacteria bacterium]HBY75262.1 hypothetical protein [Candidatus Gracilibacteria bacterium]
MPINTVQKKQGAIKEYSQNEALIINKELDKRRITNSKLVEKIIGEQNSIPFEVLAGPKDSIKLEKPETIIFSNEPYDAPISNIFLEGTYEVSELSPEVEIAMTLTGALNYCNLLNNESLE